MNTTSSSPAAAGPLGVGAKKKKAAMLLLPSWMNELGLIRMALICLTLTVALSSAMVISSTWYFNQQSNNQYQAEQLRHTAFDKFNHVENEKLEIRTYQPQFIQLRNKGLIGEENRLEWVDAIRQIQEQRKLLPITYEIEAQQPFKLEARTVMGKYRLRGSRMDLHMDLLHEVDLFNFLEDLKRRSYYALQDCSLKRSGAAQNGVVAPTLSADCTLYWLTLGSAMPDAPAKREK